MDFRALATPEALDNAFEDDGDGLCLRVLAAEDNPINQLVLKTLLHQAGVDPVVVENGAEAVAAWEAGEFDLILMDVQMPQMDGPTAARLIRKGEAASGRAPVPIIALTANAMTHQIADYLAAGMDGHVSKPIEAAKLFATLEWPPTGCCRRRPKQPDDYCGHRSRAMRFKVKPYGKSVP